MKKLMMMGVLGALSLTSFAKTSEEALMAAHEAYRSEKPGKAARELKYVFERAHENPAVTENALELYDALKESGKDVQMDWTIPSEIGRVKVKFRSGLRSDRRSFDLQVNVDMKTKAAIENLQVVKFPDHIVLDPKAGVGRAEEEYDSEYDDYQNRFNTSRYPAPLETGLYFLTISLKSGTVVKGWFLTTESSFASTHINLKTPAVGETVEGSNIQLEFDDYKSPEYKPFEKRSFYTEIGRIEGSGYKRVWDKWIGHPNLERVVVNKELTPGNYNLWLSYKEKHRLGDLHLQRQIFVSRPFKVSE